VAAGWNWVTNLDEAAVAEALAQPRPVGEPPALFGHGDAAQQIAALLQTRPGAERRLPS